MTGFPASGLAILAGFGGGGGAGGRLPATLGLSGGAVAAGRAVTTDGRAAAGALAMGAGAADVDVGANVGEGWRRLNWRVGAARRKIGINKRRPPGPMAE